MYWLRPLLAYLGYAEHYLAQLYTAVSIVARPSVPQSELVALSGEINTVSFGITKAPLAEGG